MNLPYNLELIPGLRQDHKGRFYQLGRYPSGKVVEVPIRENIAQLPAARTIPIPQALAPVQRAVSSRGAIATHARSAFVEWRDSGTSAILRDYGPQSVIDQFVGEQLRPLMRSPDCGKTWIAVESRGGADWYNQYNGDTPDAN